MKAIEPFDEPTYFHQVIARSSDGSVTRFIDLPYFLDATKDEFEEGRVHFHIPLDAAPAAPLGSTIDQVEETLEWCRKNPGECGHFEIETYTWGVLPGELQRPVEEQIAGEYGWVLNQSEA